jgi:hypothetical protein
MEHGTQESVHGILTDCVNVGDRILKGCKAFHPCCLVLSDHCRWVGWIHGIELLAEVLEILAFLLVMGSFHLELTMIISRMRSVHTVGLVG